MPAACERTDRNRTAPGLSIARARYDNSCIVRIGGKAARRPEGVEGRAVVDDGGHRAGAELDSRRVLIEELPDGRCPDDTRLAPSLSAVTRPRVDDGVRLVVVAHLSPDSDHRIRRIVHRELHPLVDAEAFAQLPRVGPREPVILRGQVVDLRRRIVVVPREQRVAEMHRSPGNRATPDVDGPARRVESRQHRRLVVEFAWCAAANDPRLVELVGLAVFLVALVQDGKRQRAPSVGPAQRDVSNEAESGDRADHRIGSPHANGRGRKAGQQPVAPGASAIGGHREPDPGVTEQLDPAVIVVGAQDQPRVVRRNVTRIFVALLVLRVAGECGVGPCRRGTQSIDVAPRNEEEIGRLGLGHTTGDEQTQGPEEDGGPPAYRQIQTHTLSMPGHGRWQGSAALGRGC